MYIGYQVKSRQLNVIGHDVKSSKLIVAFLPSAGGDISIYEYDNVDRVLFQQLVDAPSRGSFFIKNIKKDTVKHPFTRLSGTLGSVFADILPIEEYGKNKTSFSQKWKESMASVKVNNSAWCW